MRAGALEALAGGVATLLVVVSVCGQRSFAKRAPPQDVPPVVHLGVRYEAPHFLNPCEQNGGCVVAIEEATGKQLWALKVYCTQYDPDLERDVQDVFLTSMVIDGGRLAVTNEKTQRFSINLMSREVTGDARSCAAVGCSFVSAPSSGPWSLLLAVCLLFRTVRSHSTGARRWGRPAGIRKCAPK